MKLVKVFAGMTLVLIFLALSFSFVSAEREGHEIVLEEVELIFMEQGKEKKRMRVNEAKSKTVINELKSRVFKKLGVSTFKDAEEKKLLQEFNDEFTKSLKIERISPAMLCFYSDKGRAIKKIVMKRPGEAGIIKENMEGEGETSLETRRSISTDAIVAGNGKYALVTEYFAGLPKPVQHKGAKDEIRPPETWSTVRYLNAKAEVLWLEELPDNTYVNKMNVSRNGKTVAFIQVSERKRYNGKLPGVMLVALNKGKKRLLVFPEKGDASVSVSTDYIVISPNGRYIAVGGRRKDKKSVHLYFDLQEGRRWEATEEYSPANIENDGTTYTSWRVAGEEKAKRQIIDLTRHLK